MFEIKNLQKKIDWISILSLEIFYKIVKELTRFFLFEENYIKLVVKPNECIFKDILVQKTNRHVYHSCYVL